MQPVILVNKQVSDLAEMEKIWPKMYFSIWQFQICEKGRCFTIAGGTVHCVRFMILTRQKRSCTTELLNNERWWRTFWKFRTRRLAHNCLRWLKRCTNNSETRTYSWVDCMIWSFDSQPQTMFWEIELQFSLSITNSTRSLERRHCFVTRNT